LNNKFLSDELSLELTKFTDNAPWTFDDIDIEQIIEICNDNNLKIKSAKSSNSSDVEFPINSGMISLVYKVEKNDQIYILKIKRKNIDKKLTEAISDIKCIVDILHFLPIFKRFNVKNSVYKSTAMILSQLNFHEEANNIALFKENCKNLDYVKIPEVDLNFTKKYPNALLMEYINGKTIDNLEKELYVNYAPLVVKFGIVTCFFHGVTHGDLHMGNILFVEENNKYKLGILDFGIIYKLDKKIKEELFYIFSNFNNCDSNEVTEKLLLSGLIDSPEIIKTLTTDQYNDLKHTMYTVIDQLLSRSKKTNQYMIYSFLDEFNKLMKRPDIYKFNIKPSDEFVKSQISIGMAYGVTMKLIEGENLLNFFDKVMNELLHLDIMRND
jgi:predicted unusual protein kinase regulating ubiquinone biosynthesis (AarF/ABC1/UbiB family)